jgi:hypothetical protein
MQQRVAQPPIQPSRRSTERRSSSAGLALVLVGLALLCWGAIRVTRLDTLSGEDASEQQLMRDFAHAGLRISDPAALPPPSILNDPALAAAAFERMQERDREQDKRTYKVDTRAVDPCPT